MPLTLDPHSLIDVLDRILDKGVVVDAWVRISLVGIELVSTGATVIVVACDVQLFHTSLDVFLENSPYYTKKPESSKRDIRDDDEGSAPYAVRVTPRTPVLSGSAAVPIPPETDSQDEQNTSNTTNPTSKPRSGNTNPSSIKEFHNGAA